MTSSALRPRWMLYLAFALVCQTARQAEGHPRATTSVTEASPAAGSSSTPRQPQDDASSISELIETAYENSELLRRGQWSQVNESQDQAAGLPSRRDTSEQLVDAESAETSRYEKRKLLTVPNADTSSMQSDADGKIVFPTDSRVSPSMPMPTPIPTPIPTPASACQMSTFCENVVGYPKQLVNAEIARNASLRFLQSVDPTPDIVEQRIHTDESLLCQIREQVVYPQTAQNKEKQWLFVVNQDNLKQGIRIEVCINDGQECSMIQGFAEGYKTSCKQKFIYRELVAVNNDGKIIKDQFRFPSSCCCHVKFTGDVGVRIDQSETNWTNQTTMRSRARRRK